MDKSKVVTYTSITFAITWICWWGLALLTNNNIVDSSQGIFTLIYFIGGFGPTIASLLILPQKSLRSVFDFVFSCKKNSVGYLLLFCLMQGLIIGLSSMETNPLIPWFSTPIVMLSTTFLGGGNEELGWRGIMQPELEKRFSFPIATLITGCVWMLWHVPLWFVVGSSQQNMNFLLYAIYGLILSFWLATIHKKTKSIFFCCVFHGFSNLMLSFFIIKVNWTLIVGLIASLVFTIWLYYKETVKASD
ncbi:MAG: CPBP family intramembrane metalloprotease [Clostridia bacterium]|nr:CPBP family intramembrane metalloprotease [Clostridia bacterium]